MDLIDLILGSKLKGAARKVAYVVVWLLMMLFAGTVIAGIFARPLP